MLSIWEELSLHRTEFSRIIFNSPSSASIASLKLNMSLYPHLSQPQYRRCGITTDVCPTFPCVHVPYQNPDYLADYEEFLANNQVHEKTWELYNSLYEKTSSYTLKERLSVE